ncbi:TonB-linked SusC/RagA family outer membrane protein [Chitinophaga polysaccharea]|uniref:TonB-linked SusC/RagA family outer membrane protein n=1 Tax=Chitinophaga polysaccharea TaxID=1293035 RepID=A0A561Q356_9BACT|nr:SusC/RagA family TonB-linked outer membrane protein [Chitinophaga polysaccharea]TWF44807.1 TonB-linked SusC/RagA family outer membrane protein [Chitinophaga polysaccharea]
MRKLSSLLFILSLFLVSLLNTAITQAQTAGIISGKVVDAEDQSPIIGAVVTLKNSSKGAVTDAEGNFKINAPANSTLNISFIGYKSSSIVIGTQITLTIPLQKDNKALNEVVVTALGINKQSKALGYAVQTVNTKQLTQAPDPNLINNLGGKVAGVVITNGGAGVGSTSRIVIRGENSFNGSNQPLFVVDGVPINNETFFNNAIENSSNQGTWAEVDWGNGAAEINPNNIAKVTVLKGSTAAALYGSRAANGAVVLTTEKGNTEKGKMGVTFNTTTTFESPLKLPHLQNEYGAGVNAYPLSGTPNTYSFVNGAGASENNIPNWGLKFDPSVKVTQFDSPAGDGYQAGDLVARGINPGLTVTPTPWVGHADHFKQFLQTGLTTQNSIGFGGTTDKGSYHFAVDQLYNKGILPGTDLKRYGIALRADHHFTDKLSTDFFINYINSGSSNRPNIGYGSESVMYTFFGVYGMPINIDINSLKKEWQTGRDQQNQFRYWNNHDNPYVTLNDNTNSFTKNRILGNASLKYAINDQWNVMLRTGSDFYADNREGHRAFTSVRFPTGGFRTDNVNYFENNTDFLVSYHKKPSHLFNVNASLGGNRFMQNIAYTRNIANALITPGLYNFSNAQNQLPTLYQKFDKVVYSLYAFADFDFKNLVFLNVTGRNDRSSTLPAGNNSYFYPSASLSAIISDMVHLPQAISFLKVRASAAQVGRDADPYSINNTFITNTPFNGTPLTTGNNVLANNSLKPSSTTTTEAGIEVRFLKNRVGLDATIYQSNTKDEVVQLPIAVSSGYTNAYVNGGKINNKGVEIMLTGTPFRSHAANGFNWDMSFNFSHNVGKVVSLPDGINTYVYAQVTQYDRYYRAIQYDAKVGQRLGNMYGNAFVRDPQGNIVYKNGVPQFTSTQNSLLGNYNPDFVLAWSNELSYKNFTMSFLWDWHQGGKFFSYTELGVLAGGMSVETLPGRETGVIGQGVMMDASSGKYVPNTVKVDAATYYNGYYNASNNEAFMYDASYLKLRELRIGYTFKNIFGKSSNSKLNVSLIGRNILEFTKNKDVDPETLALRGQQILPGTEFLSIPSTKSMGFSLGLNF